jgi:predicted Fe-Mo cluster-binding NifX family protein
MKIAVSAAGRNNDSVLDKRFGRCEYFQIIDMNTNETKVLSNNGASSSGGAGIAAASQVIEEKADILITGNLGPNAFELIEKAGIKPYSCEKIPISEAVEMFQQNKLEAISISGNAHHGA